MGGGGGFEGGIWVLCLMVGGRGLCRIWCGGDDGVRG